MRRLAFLVLVAFAMLCASAGARELGGLPVALVTAEHQNELLAVSLPDGRVLRRVTLAADPENVASQTTGPAVVVSTRGRAVTVLEWRTLSVLRVLHGFVSPHLAAISPDGEWAYVTDDGAGTLVVIRLARTKVVARVRVGVGVHHLAFSPDQSRVWVALGERARSIAILGGRPDRPRLLRRYSPGFDVHDLAFSPDGSDVWLTSDTTDRVTVVDARTLRVRFQVAAGPPPQHVAFSSRGFAYVTSGNGAQIEEVNPDTGRVLRTRTVSRGSYNLATSGGLVVTSSLLNGTVTEFDDNLRPLADAQPATVARDVALSVW